MKMQLSKNILIAGSWLLMGLFVIPIMTFAQENSQLNPMTLNLGKSYKVQWDTHPDTSVVAFNLYVFGVDSIYERRVVFSDWYNSSDQVTSLKHYKMDVPLGLAYLQLSATNRRGVEGAKSGKFWAMVEDPGPDAPTGFGVIDLE